jgi:hypothetical protein
MAWPRPHRAHRNKKNPMPITFIVIGGGCYGSHHLKQLESGRAKGYIEAEARIVVVDRNPTCQVVREQAARPNPFVTVVQSDWLAYYQAHIDTLPADAEIVPAPIAPHLAAEWLLWSLQQRLGAEAVQQAPFTETFGGLPYEYLSPGGDRFISAADWICPPNCRAPKQCPIIMAPRTCDLSTTIREFAAARPDRYLEPIIFTTVYRATGIETIPVGVFRAVRDRVLAQAATSTSGKALIVATCSPCHGATTLLQFKAEG